MSIHAHPVEPKTIRERVALVREAVLDPGNLALRIQDGLGWRFPALVICISIVLLDLLALPLFLKSIPLTAPGGLDPQMLAKVERTSQVMAPIKAFLKPIGFLMTWTACSFLGFLMSLVIGKRLKFQQLHTLMVYSSLLWPLEVVVRELVHWSRYWITGSPELFPLFGLDAIMHPDQVLLAALVAHVNVFEIWFLILLISGVAVLGQFSKRTAAMIVLPVWALAVLSHIAYALVRQIMLAQLRS